MLFLTSPLYIVIVFAESGDSYIYFDLFVTDAQPRLAII